MGDLWPSIPKSTLASELDANGTLIPGLDEYATDEELAAVELFKDYPEALLRLASVCCVLFMLVGIPGNLITIVALARCKKLKWQWAGHIARRTDELKMEGTRAATTNWTRQRGTSRTGWIDDLVRVEGRLQVARDRTSWKSSVEPYANSEHSVVQLKEQYQFYHSN
ncbi:hypothetical protein EVAR_28951_1 [Eumeta japonica]|uniref:G-protein coupled receptors family 1 profile domain-containing protein n=1 Tax=Eumeta variegata TaxID=151549 RepID=A0A4C1W145_EUMVA|nr:hypothetical protein EVAR_28951_1 [Eumeta japonica]